MTTITPPLKWHEISGCPGYRVYEDGSVWSCWKFKGAGYGGKCKQVMSDDWKRLKPNARKEDNRKRYTVRRADGTYRRAYANHFVLEAFVGPRGSGLEACHKDGDCTNDAAVNLRWDTPKANKADMLRHGTRAMGENHPKTKLSDADIDKILQSDGSVSNTSLAKTYGVSITRIGQIIKKGGR